MLISIARGGQEIGEWSEEQVRAGYLDGQFVADDLYWHEGMPDWKPLRSLIKPALPSQSLHEAEDPPSVPVVQPAASEGMADAVTLVAPPPLPQTPSAVKPRRNWEAESLGCARLFVGVTVMCVGYGLTKSFLLTDREFMMEVFYGALAGFLCGLVPLVIAKRKGLPCQRYFLICGGCGAVGGLLLALPVCVGWVVYLCMKKRKGHS